MRARFIVPTAIAVLSIGLTACSDEGGNEADCKAEITKQLETGKYSKDTPEVCKGIDKKTLDRLAKEAVSEAKPKTP